MTAVNKVFLLGNMGKAPELKFTATGDAVLNFSLATSESWKDKNSGEKKEKTEWHRITAFGKPAELIAQFTDKGSKLFVEGKLVNRDFTTNDGQQKSITEVRVTDFMFLDKKNSNAAPTPAAPETDIPF